MGGAGPGVKFILSPSAHGTSMTQPNRSEDRVSMVVPVSLPGGAAGITRDISATGIYFETDASTAVDRPLDFTVEFSNDAGGMTLRCKGEVIRVEHLGTRIGVAARILESKLEPGRARVVPGRIEISDGFADSF